MSTYLVIACDAPVDDGGKPDRPCPQLWFGPRRVISREQMRSLSADDGWTHDVDPDSDSSRCPVHSS